MKTVEEVALEVINGLWGNGAERKRRLEEAGYNYEKVQETVNKILSGEIAPDPPKTDKVMDVTISLKEYSGIRIVFEE